MRMHALEGPGGTSWVVAWRGAGRSREPRCILTREGKG